MAGDNENSISTRDSVGLCANCRFMREQGTKRGAVFFRCARADEDETFKRYPPIPVLRCRGFEGSGHERGEEPGMD